MASSSERRTLKETSLSSPVRLCYKSIRPWNIKRRLKSPRFLNSIRCRMKKILLIDNFDSFTF